MEKGLFLIKVLIRIEINLVIRSEQGPSYSK